MEKTASKHVDRQATFDTDPRREHLAHGIIKLPVIEAREQERRKSELREIKNKHVKIKSNPSIIEPNNNANTASTEEETKTHIPAVNVSVSDRKLNVLSHINKKVAIANSSEGLQEVKFSKDTNATVKVSSTSPKASKTTENTVKKITNHNNTAKSGDKSGTGNSEATSEFGIKSGKFTAKSTNTGNELKNVDNQQTPGNSETSQKNDNTVTKKTNSGVKDPISDNNPKGRVNRSRSPEKQNASKISVLKDLNRKRSVSPAKDRNLNPQKESKSTNQSGKSQVKQQNSKLVDTKPTQNNGSNVKSSDDKTVRTPRPLPRPTPRTKQDTAKNSSLSNQKKDSPTRKVDNKQNNSNISKEIKDKNLITKRTLPANNAPAETHFLESEPKDIIKEKNVKVSPRPKVQRRKQQPPVDSKSKYYDIKETTSRQRKTVANSLKENNSDNDRSNSSNGSHENVKQTIEPVPPRLKLSDENADNQPIKVSVDSGHITNNDQISGDVQNSTDRVVNASVQNKHETYVLSPSPTKYDPKSPVTHKVSRPSRLSPSNESVESIKLEQRPINDRNSMDIDRRESYAQVYAERNTLLNAEFTYRKRIKQLEDEANGFLIAIDELTTENKYLRRRVDALEGELSGNGDLRTIERISDLEKDKIELENKVKQLQQNSKTNDNANEIRELKEQVVQLQSENHKNNEENMNLKSENHEFTKALQSLEAEKKSLATSITDVGSEKLDKLKDLSRQKQVNKQLMELKTKTQSLEKKVNALEYENKVLSETLVAKKSELNELLGVMKDENKFDDEIKDLKNIILKLNNEKKETELSHNKEKRILNEKLRDTKSALETKTKDVDELKITLDQMDSEHKKMKSDFDPMKKLIESQKKEIAKLKEENRLLKQELQDSKDLYATLENETTNASNDLKETKEQLEHFNKELQKIVSDKESQINKLINQLDTIRAERENERKVAKDEKENLASEIEKVETYQTKAKRLETDLKQLVEKHDESKLKERQLTIQLEDKSFHVSNLEQQVFEMNMKMDTHSKRMSELDREKREIEKEKRGWDVKKDKLDDIEASNKRLLEENKRLRNQIEMSSYQKDYRPPERSAEEKPIEAWINDNARSQAVNHAIYVQKDKGRDRVRRRVHLAHVQSSIQKKRLPFSKSSPVKDSRHHRKEESKSSNPSTHRSLEDLRNISDNKTPESEHSLPELKQDARLTMGYGSFGGYREIHKNRIKAANKRVY